MTKLCLAGGSYVAFLQGAGNPYSAAGMCLPHKSPTVLAVPWQAQQGDQELSKQGVCAGMLTQGGSGVAQGSLC